MLTGLILVSGDQARDEKSLTPRCVCTPEGDTSLLVQDPSQQQLQGQMLARCMPCQRVCSAAPPNPPSFVVVIFYKLSLGMNELPAASARGLLKRVRHTKGSAGVKIAQGGKARTGAATPFVTCISLCRRPRSHSLTLHSPASAKKRALRSTGAPSKLYPPRREHCAKLNFRLINGHVCELRMQICCAKLCVALVAADFNFELHPECNIKYNPLNKSCKC